MHLWQFLVTKLLSVSQVATEIVDMADKKLLNFTVNKQLILVERAQLSGVVVISPGRSLLPQAG